MRASAHVPESNSGPPNWMAAWLPVTDTLCTVSGEDSKALKGGPPRTANMASRAVRRSAAGSPLMGKVVCCETSESPQPIGRPDAPPSSGRTR